VESEVEDVLTRGSECLHLKLTLLDAAQDMGSSRFGIRLLCLNGSLKES
jgi:hypothetical protein